MQEGVLEHPLMEGGGALVLPAVPLTPPDFPRQPVLLPVFKPRPLHLG